MKLLGRMFGWARAGEKHLAWNDPAAASAPACIALESTAFAERSLIPRKHAGKGVGDDVSPALAWSGLPVETAELVLIIEDPDAPLPRPFVHAVVVGIPSSMNGLTEGRLSEPPAIWQHSGLSFGKNTLGKTVYGGPRPIPGHGPHTYVFQLFALDRRLSFERAPSRGDVVREMRGAVIARGRLDGIYER